MPTEEQNDASPTLPAGFQYAAVACGIKASGKEDVTLIATTEPSICAGVYTQNIVRAASIDWNRQITPTDSFRAVVINSGNANACTGDQGVRDNAAMAQAVGDALQMDHSRVAVLSTGIIGVHLPMENVLSGIADAARDLGSDVAHFDAASRGITTTDNAPKTVHRTVDIDGVPIQIAAMAKGAGMIGPRMATMLAIVTTDAAVSPESAQTILQTAADRSFNRISVEGHTSTNDALLLIASGKSAAKIDSDEAIERLTAAVTDCCVELCKKIPADGEGATHLIQIDVSGAASDADADAVARTVANSALVKTAITGADPNWGRIVSAAGYAGVNFAANDLTLAINGTPLYREGQPVAFNEANVSKSIGEEFETFIEISLGNGSGSSRHWTSDLTVDYVRFNSEYTT